MIFREKKRFQKLELSLLFALIVFFHHAADDTSGIWRHVFSLPPANRDRASA